MKMPTYFISHGGGPWPWLDGPMGDGARNLRASLVQWPGELPAKPKAILVISGHWEAPAFKIMANANPPMLYDYGGFPEHTYHVQYPAPGAPALARQIETLLAGSGFPTLLDEDRGFDHGTFVPLAVAFPAADIPVLQLSLLRGYDPRTHLQVGQTLAPLRDEGVLIIGSGLSYHNLRAMDERGSAPSHEFDAWLRHTILASDVEGLMKWTQAPSARLAHPREDHLMPLMVACGAGLGDAANVCYHEDDFFGGLAVTSFRFG